VFENETFQNVGGELSPLSESAKNLMDGPMKSDRREFLRMSGGVLASGILPRPRPLLATPSTTPSTVIDAGVKKVILDTDPGVDDAFALLLAMRSSELKVVAITAVAGNVPLSVTLPNALRLVEIAERPDIPVAAGASSPLIRNLVTAAYAHGNNGLAGVEFPPARLRPVKEPASDLICSLVRENAHNVCIVGIGPLTNIALALRQDPEIASMVSSIVLMGGSLSGGNVTPAAEFNFYVDPEAASMVFASGIPIRMVGLDVTRKVQLTERHVKTLQAAKGPVSEAAARIAEAVMKMHRGADSERGPNLHDPLAVSSLIQPDILTFEDYQVEIETMGSITAGESVGWKHAPARRAAPMEMTAAAENSNDFPFRANAKVATGVDSEKFFELLISRLTGR
jgi:inosine-uridine nucleoside N-ribohydrolase